MLAEKMGDRWVESMVELMVELMVGRKDKRKVD